MPLDPVTALVFAMHSSRGTYALLLGSGVSSAAGIPTGWAIVGDLIHRIAAAEGAEIGGDPERWYFETHGEVPRYSGLLDQLAKTPSERQAIIRGYVEPSEEQRIAGERLPTAAHHAVARLAAGGYVRVVLTTNFDRLLEQALDQRGVQFDVIDDADALAGARPISQSPLVVIKLHGDYRDARIRNTTAELERYDSRMDALLDRVLDEFGLIVCGWSAEWDTALRAAIARQPSRRFTTYWSARGEITSEARDLIAKRDAKLIVGRDANVLFTEIESKVAALADVDRPHPLSVEIATAELKRYLPDERARIRLEDLVMGEAERAAQAIAAKLFPADGPSSLEDTQSRLARYQAAVEILRVLLAVGCWHSAGTSQDRLWSRALERLTEFPEIEGGLSRNIALRRYPALICLYAAGIAALAAERWSTVREVLLGRQVIDSRGHGVPYVAGVNPITAFTDIDLQAVLQPTRQGDRGRTPISDYLREQLREALKPVVAADALYTEAFDRFEFLLGMTLIDLRAHHTGDGYVPDGYVGAFAWRYERTQRSGLAEWSTAAATNLLGAGFFATDRSRLESAQTGMLELTKATGGRWF